METGDCPVPEVLSSTSLSTKAALRKPVVYNKTLRIDLSHQLNKSGTETELFQEMQIQKLPSIKFYEVPKSTESDVFILYTKKILTYWMSQKSMQISSASMFNYRPIFDVVTA